MRNYYTVVYIFFLFVSVVYPVKKEKYFVFTNNKCERNILNKNFFSETVLKNSVIPLLSDREDNSDLLIVDYSKIFSLPHKYKLKEFDVKKIKTDIFYLKSGRFDNNQYFLPFSFSVNLTVYNKKFVTDFYYYMHSESKELTDTLKKMFDTDFSSCVNVSRNPGGWNYKDVIAAAFFAKKSAKNINPVGLPALPKENISKLVFNELLQLNDGDTLFLERYLPAVLYKYALLNYYGLIYSRKYVSEDSVITAFLNGKVLFAVLSNKAVFEMMKRAFSYKEYADIKDEIIFTHLPYNFNLTDSSDNKKRIPYILIDGRCILKIDKKKNYDEFTFNIVNQLYKIQNNIFFRCGALPVSEDCYINMDSTFRNTWKEKILNLSYEILKENFVLDRRATWNKYLELKEVIYLLWNEIVFNNSKKPDINYIRFIINKKYGVKLIEGK